MLQLLYPQHDLAEMALARMWACAASASASEKTRSIAHALGDRPHLVAAASAKGDAEVLDAAQRMQVEIDVREWRSLFAWR